MKAADLRRIQRKLRDGARAIDLDIDLKAFRAARERNHQAKSPLLITANTRAVEASELVKHVGDRERAYIMSSATPAGMFLDVVPAKAWQLDTFRKRESPLLWMHGREGGPPMGRMRSVRKNVELDGVRVLAGIAKFAPEGMDERVDSLWPMIEGGFLNAGSVGFHVRAAHWPTEEEAEEMGLDLEGEHRMTEIVDKAELVEYSIVPVGADHKAMVLRDVNDEGLELRAFMDQLLDSGTWTRDDALWVREVFRSEIPEEDEDDGGDEPQETIEVSGTDAENDDAEEAEEADTEADGAAADGEVDDDPSAPGEGEEAGEGEASDDESGESDDEERVLDLLSVEEMEAIVRDAIAASEAPPAEENDADSSDSSRDEILVRTVATIFANEIRELRSEIDTIRKEVREQRNRQSALDAALGLLPAVAAS